MPEATRAWCVGFRGPLGRGVEWGWLSSEAQKAGRPGADGAGRLAREKNQKPSCMGYSSTKSRTGRLVVVLGCSALVGGGDGVGGEVGELQADRRGHTAFRGSASVYLSPWGTECRHLWGLARQGARERSPQLPRSSPLWTPGKGGGQGGGWAGGQDPAKAPGLSCALLRPRKAQVRP